MSLPLVNSLLMQEILETRVFLLQLGRTLDCLTGLKEPLLFEHYCWPLYNPRHSEGELSDNHTAIVPQFLPNPEKYPFYPLTAFLTTVGKAVRVPMGTERTHPV